MNFARFKARLLGFKTIEASDHHAVIQLPLWLASNETAKARVVENLRKDLAIYGRDVDVTVGARVVRIERKPTVDIHVDQDRWKAFIDRTKGTSPTRHTVGEPGGEERDRAWDAYGHRRGTPSGRADGGRGSRTLTESGELDQP